MQGSKKSEKENNIHEANFATKIPIIEEKFSIGKKTVSEDVKIEKRWVTKTIKQESKSRQITTRGELVPLSNKSKENEKIIPLWGEQITINKKMIRLEDLVITKRKITENKKIDIDTKKEKVTIRYPDGSTKQLTT